MKKLLCVGVALTFLSACTSYDPDLDSAAEERAANRAEIRNQIGCQFPNDHDAYRRCVLATYERNKPKTFTTAQDCSGQPVAVVSDGVSKGTVYAEVVSSCAEKKEAEKAPATEPAQPKQVVHDLGTIPCDASLGACMYATQELYQGQMEPCTNCAPQPVVVQEPKVVTVEQTETVVQKPLEVVPAPQPLPDKTWWETYQEEKQPEKPKVVCPCPDPNDPCPQCVTK